MQKFLTDGQYFRFVKRVKCVWFPGACDSVSYCVSWLAANIPQTEQRNLEQEATRVNGYSADSNVFVFIYIYECFYI